MTQLLCANFNIQIVKFKSLHVVYKHDNFQEDQRNKCCVLFFPCTLYTHRRARGLVSRLLDKCMSSCMRLLHKNCNRRLRYTQNSIQLISMIFQLTRKPVSAYMNTCLAPSVYKEMCLCVREYMSSLFQYKSNPLDNPFRKQV